MNSKMIHIATVFTWKLQTKITILDSSSNPPLWSASTCSAHRITSNLIFLARAMLWHNALSCNLSFCHCHLDNHNLVLDISSFKTFVSAFLLCISYDELVVQGICAVLWVHCFCCSWINVATFYSQAHWSLMMVSLSWLGNIFYFFMDE